VKRQKPRELPEQESRLGDEQVLRFLDQIVMDAGSQRTLERLRAESSILKSRFARSYVRRSAD